VVHVARQSEIARNLSRARAVSLTNLISLFWVLMFARYS